MNAVVNGKQTPFAYPFFHSILHIRKPLLCGNVVIDYVVNDTAEKCYYKIVTRKRLSLALQKKFNVGFALFELANDILNVVYNRFSVLFNRRGQS